MNFEVFHFTEQDLNQALSLAMAKGADFADVYAEYSHYRSFILEESILKTASAGTSAGIGVRAVKGEKTGYAFTELLEPEWVLDAARTAASISEGRLTVPPVAVGRRHFPQHYAQSFPSLVTSKEVAFLQMADQIARQMSEYVTHVTVSLATGEPLVVIASSRGEWGQDLQGMMRFNVHVVVERHGVREDAQAGFGGRFGSAYVTEERVREVCRQAVDEALTLLDAKPAPAGSFPIVLASGDSGILLHEAVGHPLEADFNRRQTSAYAGRMGEQVASPLCTIVDDGTVFEDRGSLNFDDELNPSQRTVLIDGGKLVSYMYDEMSARFYGVASTGNGRRENYQVAPMPRMRSTYLLPGESHPEEIIASTTRGIYCKTFKGGQVDISNGNFIFIPSEAYWIEGGKISHPVKNFSLIGNGPDAMTKVSMVGNDFRMSPGIWTCGKGQSVPVGVGLPTVKISEMTVGGAAQ